MATLLLIDDHALFRAALTSVLERLAPELTIQQAPDLASGLRHCEQVAPPDLLLLDLGLPDVQGEQAVKACLSAHPDLPVVMVSATTDHDLVKRGLTAGAKAFIHKSDAPQRMMATLAPWLKQTEDKTPSATALPPSPRQLEVLHCLCQGLTTSKAIARQLGLSEYTVRQHLAEVFRRLGVNNRAQAMVAAQRWLSSVHPVSSAVGDGDTQG